MFSTKALACLLLAFPVYVFSQTSGCSGTIVSSGGRKIAIVIDSSGSMADSDPNNLRIAAGQALANSLLATDLVTVIDFDDSARIVSPLGPPPTASFVGIDADGGTYIAGGLELALDELTHNGTAISSHTSGVIVFTDGEDSSVDELVVQLKRAASLGIRVSFGFLSADLSAQDPSVLAGILQTNGIYSTITTNTAQSTFISLVQSHGLVDTDSNSANTLLLPGLITAGNVSSTSGPKAFTYDAVAGESLNFTLQAVSTQAFTIKLRDSTANKDISSANTDATGQAQVLYSVTAATELELDVSTTNTTSGLFTVQISSSVNRTINVCPGTNNTNTNTTTSVGTTATLKPTNTATFTAGTTTTKAPIFTGAAAVVRGIGMAAVFPVLIAVVL